MKRLKSTPLALALAAGLALAGLVAAQAAPPTPAQQQELEAARGELQRAARRLAELSRKYGMQEGPMRLEHRVLRKPVVGVLLALDAAAGVRIAGVTPGSAAAEAGLRSGDRLTSVNGQEIPGATGELRLENARRLLGGLDGTSAARLGYARDGRNAVVSVTPKPDKRVFMFRDADGTASHFEGAMLIRRGTHGELDATAGGIEMDRLAGGIAPEVHAEIIRIGDAGKQRCKQGDCRFTALAEAFRWNGLNLASVDARLGRYFGADRGVLVLSAGEDLPGLQPGDVIRGIDGKPVATPREAMEALRAKPADSTVRVDYLRDREAGSARLKVPKAMPFRIPLPPPPPAPPAPPAPPQPPAAMAAPHAAHAPPPGNARRIEKRRIVTVDAGGNRQEWEDDGTGALPPPPAPPTPPVPPPPPPPTLD